MGRQQILWIEDRLDEYGFLVAKLEAEDYKVIGADTGEEGLAMARRSRPDLVLLDLQLAGISGWNVYLKLKEDPETSDIPVIVYTVESAIDSEMIGRMAGVDDFVTKKVSADELVARVGKVLAEHKLKQVDAQNNGMFKPMLRCFLTGGPECGRYVTDINRGPYTVFLGYQFNSKHYSSANLVDMVVKATQIVSGDYQERGLALHLDQVGHREGDHIACEVCEKIQRSVFSVFEVSDLNPNVMIELGMALGTGKKIALLRHREGKPPCMDMSGLKYIPYHNRLSLTVCSSSLAAEIERYFEEIDLVSGSD